MRSDCEAVIDGDLGSSSGLLVLARIYILPNLATFLRSYASVEQSTVEQLGGSNCDRVTAAGNAEAATSRGARPFQVPSIYSQSFSCVELPRILQNRSTDEIT